MHRLVLVFALILIVVPVAAAEDFTGKWSGTFIITGPDGKPSTDTITMALTQKGTALTGTVATGESGPKPLPIANGMVDGNKVTFELRDGTLVTTVRLTFAGGHLKGDAVLNSGGSKLGGIIDVQRTK